MRLALLTLGVVLCAGCGTIMNGSTQEVSFASSPTGATVTVDGLDLGETPLVAALSRKNTHTVVFDLDGYESEAVIVNKTVSGWVWGNIVFGGLIGLGVDAVTGGLYKLSPDQVTASMESETATLPSSDGLYVTVVLAPAPGWERIGTLTRWE